MKNEIMLFSNQEFGDVRTVIVDGVPYFVGKDVAEILGYSNPNEAISEHIDSDDKLNSKTLSSFELNLGQRGGWLINESGLYSLILSSKLPKAKAFKHWVTSEILPSIRKTGSYSVIEKPDSYMIDDPIERAMRWIEEEEERQALRVHIEETKPLVDYAEQIQTADTSIDMLTMAKLLSKKNIKIGRNKLFEFLRNKNVLMKDNVPYGRYMDNGWFELQENVWRDSYGTKNISTTTLVTPKGQVGITNLVLKSIK